MQTETKYTDMPALATGGSKRKAAGRSQLFKRLRDSWVFYLCIAPFFVLFAVFGAYPILASFYESFTSWDGLSQPVFVGVSNYINIFRDPTFLGIIGNTLYIWISSTIITLVLAFTLAFLVNYYISRFRGFFRVVFLFPLLIAPALTAIIVNALFSSNTGLVNTLVGFFVGHKVTYDWFGSGFWIKPMIVLIIIWRWTGWHFTLFMAGLQTIPTEVYEAARIDGARGPQIFRYMTFPLMLPVILVSAVSATIGGIQVFDEAYVLTNGTGGTLQQGTTLGLYQYQSAFQNFNFGLAASVSYVIFALVVFFAVLNFRLLRGDRN